MRSQRMKLTKKLNVNRLIPPRRYEKKHSQCMMFGQMTPPDRVMNSRGLNRYSRLLGEQNQQARQSFNIKMAVVNKNLKQC